MGKIKNVLSAIAGWFQPTYNKIKKLDWPPEIHAKIDEFWADIEPALQTALVDFIGAIYKKNVELAEKLLAELLKKLSIKKEG